MKKRLLAISLFVAILVTWQSPYAAAVAIKPETESRELQLQDMLVLFLLPYMNDKLAEGYSNELKGAPDLYPYFVDVIHIERVNGFRGFVFFITLEATPTVGPHISVGRDRFTFEISVGPKATLKHYEHLEGPEKKNFPPNYLDLLK